MSRALMRELVHRRDDEEIALDGLRIFPRLHLVMRHGRKLEIGRRAFDLLHALLEADGEILTKDDLLKRIWPNEIVDENNLHAQVSALRRALGPDRNLIDTVFGRGYRLAPRGGVARHTVSCDPMVARIPRSSLALSSLIGREGDLINLTEALASGPLVTVTGAGGIGKTRVALALSRQLADGFEDGVVLIEFADLTGRGLVLPTILSKLGIGIGWNHLSRETRADLQTRRSLLVLDNCEHLLDEVAAAIEYVLHLLPRTRILTTTREPLGMDGEQVFRLAPLGLPPERIESLDEALRYPAVQLLVQRIQAAERQFRLSDARAPALCAVCHRLDGMPLALELAAARVGQVGLDAVVAGLGDRLSVLATGQRTAMPRHQTLRATLDWSYGLLTSEEQALLRRLGVFAGSFTLMAAAEIACPEIKSIWHVADLLGGLAAKSMIVKDVYGADARFRLLETVRAFALELLLPTGEMQAISARHAAFFRARLECGAESLRRGACEPWLREFAGDLSDVRAALDCTFACDEPSVGIRSLCASLPFWMQLSLLGECRERVAGALDGFAGALRDEPGLEIPLRAALGASTTWARGPVPAAGAAWRRALDLAEALNEREYRLQAYYGLWLYTLRSGDYAQSLQWAETLQREGAAEADVEAEAAGRRTAGVSRHFLGDHGRAADMIGAVLRPACAGPMPFALRFGLDQQSAALSFLARVLCVQGEVEQARDLAWQAVEAARRLGHVLTLCCALLEGSCTVAAISADYEFLQLQALEVISIAEMHGLEFWRLYGQAFLDLAILMRGRTPAAAARLRDTVAELREVNFDLGYTVVVLRFAEVLIGIGLDQTQEGLLLINELEGRSADAHWARPEILRIKALAMQGMDGCAPAQNTRRLLEDALQLAGVHGARLWQERIQSDLDSGKWHGKRRDGSRRSLTGERVENAAIVDTSTARAARFSS